ncbi:MAG: M24 family metallopeptidase [Chloroflexi bacterium]|nr:M24 family metallopeptidase [Chloroflexota bacterium]
MDEYEQKLGLIRSWMADRKLGALFLQRVSSFAWATCGAASYINVASTDGVASLLITPDHQYLFTNNIEAPRLEKEEKLPDQGWDFRIAPWNGTKDTVAGLTRGLSLASDGFFPGALDVSSELARLRACLSSEEVARFRVLGALCAQAMDAAIHAVKPSMTENAITGMLAGEAEKCAVQAIVNLIATDERIYDYRHPLPTEKKFERYAMLVLCGRHRGLVCSLTRFVHFGRLPDELRRRAEAVARIDATYIASTRPGQTLGAIFEQAVAAYAAAGFAEEWQRHHQGGPAGYEPREYLATPGSKEIVASGQVYAWNPTITGSKSEDSVLINENGFEILSAIPGWPMVKVEVGGRIIERPDILIVK